MERKQRNYCLASADEALEMLDAYVVGERRLLQLRHELGQAPDDVRAAGDELLASLMAKQQFRYEALEAWWETPRTGATATDLDMVPQSPGPKQPGSGRFWRWLSPFPAALSRMS